MAMNQTISSTRVKSTLTSDQTAELREAFALFDSENKGSLDARELKAAIRALGFDVKKEQVRKMMSELGKENGDLFTYEDFAAVIRPRMHEKGTREEIMKIFRLFDDEQAGVITFKNLKRISLEIGENISDEELRDMLNEADRDGDGALNFEEFYRVMKRRNDDALSCWSSDTDGEE